MLIVVSPSANVCIAKKSSELAELTKNKVGTVTNWIYTGKIPKSITKKVTKGKTHKWLIDSKKGIKAIECIKLNIDFVDK